MGEIPEEEILAEGPDEELVNNYSVADIFANYGWLMVISGVCLYFMWIKILRPKYDSYKSKQENLRESAMHHRDPDYALRRLQGLEEARQRLQAQHDNSVAQHLEKQKQQEELKRQEKINNWEQHKKGLGYHNKSKSEDKVEVSPTLPSSSKPKARLRQNDYNPLMGSGENACFRTSRRGQGGG